MASFAAGPDSFKVALRPCPLCTGKGVRVLHRQRFALPDGCPLPVAYDLVACNECGFVYADTPGTQGDYDRYYELFSKYEDPAVATGSGDSSPDLIRLDTTAVTLGGIIAAPLDRLHVLDIGCAGGGLLQALRRWGFVRLTGLDPSSACVARVRAERFQAVQGKVSDLPILEGVGLYDIIVLSHVLEHVVDVRETMLALPRFLAERGVIYIEVPDAGRYAEYPFVPFYYFDAEHINHFDLASLANLAATTGFRVAASGQKEIAVADGRLYPAVWVALAVAQTKETLSRARDLAGRVAAYILQSQAKVDHTALTRLAADQRPVVLWGAGSHSQRLLEQSPLGQCRIAIVVDRDRVKQGKTFAGVEIQSPEAGLHGVAPDAVVVVASVLHGQSIAAEVRALGIYNDLLIV